MPGAAYVPFCGDGDIALALYSDRLVLGADLDPNRVELCASRLAGAEVRVADCDGWPFRDRSDTIAVADFDSYSYPYESFRAFWENGSKADRVVMFFTDGQKQSIARGRSWRMPDGAKMELPSILKGGGERRRYFNMWYAKHCLPYVAAAVAPWRITRKMVYQRGHMVYFGVACEP